MSLTELVRARLPDAIQAVHAQHGDETLIVAPHRWHDVALLLRDAPEAKMNVMVDLTAVDFPDREPRFEVVCHLLSLELGHRIRLKTRVGDAVGERVEVDSISDLWGAANWAERECFDMFGVRFLGHPDLRRLLMYPEFIGHPLRKDYPAQKIQPLVPFREVPNTDKLPPFDEHEGMSFGRQTHQWVAEQEDDEDLLAPRRGARPS